MSRQIADCSLKGKNNLAVSTICAMSLSGLSVVVLRLSHLLSPITL